MAMGYKAAIRWIVMNDDTEWAMNPDGYMSVTALMVADIYGKEEKKVRRDIERAIKEEGK